jgi:hypothetical protein
VLDKIRKAPVGEVMRAMLLVETARVSLRDGQYKKNNKVMHLSHPWCVPDIVNATQSEGDTTWQGTEPPDWTADATYVQGANHLIRALILAHWTRPQTTFESPAAAADSPNGDHGDGGHGGLDMLAAAVANGPQRRMPRRGDTGLRKMSNAADSIAWPRLSAFESDHVMAAIAHLKTTSEETDFVLRQARRARVRRANGRMTLYHPLCVSAVVRASRSSVDRVPNVAWGGPEIQVESFTHLGRALLTARRSGAPGDDEAEEEEEEEADGESS